MKCNFDSLEFRYVNVCGEHHALAFRRNLVLTKFKLLTLSVLKCQSC